MHFKHLLTRMKDSFKIDKENNFKCFESPVMNKLNPLNKTE